VELNRELEDTKEINTRVSKNCETLQNENIELKTKFESFTKKEIQYENKFAYLQSRLELVK
jgi:hypothetical protein